MKFLLCMLCNEFVQMKKEIQYCSCGNVRGRYLPDNFSIEIAMGNSKMVRVVGVSNSWIKESVNQRYSLYPFGVSVKEAKDMDDASLGSMVKAKLNGGDDLFDRRGSAIIMVPPYTTGDVQPLNEDRDSMLYREGLKVVRAVASFVTSFKIMGLEADEGYLWFSIYKDEKLRKVPIRARSPVDMAVHLLDVMGRWEELQ